MGAEFIIWFSVCFVCSTIRTIYNILNTKQSPVVQNKIIPIFISMIMGLFWFSWFQMCFSDPKKINFPFWIRGVGLSLFISGVLLFLLSHFKMRATSKGHFATEGIYSRIRNPMYLGFIIWLIGFPIFTKSLITFFSSLVWISFIMIWKILEEKDLDKKFKSYREYKNRTWF